MRYWPDSPRAYVLAFEAGRGGVEATCRCATYLAHERGCGLTLILVSLGETNQQAERLYKRSRLVRVS
jgi:hypothetical protein